jgi:hypothetical protein
LYFVRSIWVFVIPYHRDKKLSVSLCVFVRRFTHNRVLGGELGVLLPLGRPGQRPAGICGIWIYACVTGRMNGADFRDVQLIACMRAL